MMQEHNLPTDLDLNNLVSDCTLNFTYALHMLIGNGYKISISYNGDVYSWIIRVKNVSLNGLLGFVDSYGNSLSGALWGLLVKLSSANLLDAKLWDFCQYSLDRKTVRYIYYKKRRQK